MDIESKFKVLYNNRKHGKVFICQTPEFGSDSILLFQYIESILLEAGFESDLYRLEHFRSRLLNNVRVTYSIYNCGKRSHLEWEIVKASKNSITVSRALFSEAFELLPKETKKVLAMNLNVFI